MHLTLFHKYVIIYLLFHHCLLKEGSHYFDIVLLILWFIFLSVDFFGLQELFEGWAHIEIHKNKNFFHYLFFPKMDIPTTQEILLFRIMLCTIVLFFGATYEITLLIDSFFVCRTCAVIFSELCLFETENVVLRWLYIWLSFSLQYKNCLCSCIPSLILMLLSWSTTLKYI